MKEIDGDSIIDYGLLNENFKECDNHNKDENNPHNVTVEQIGAAGEGHTHDERYYTKACYKAIIIAITIITNYDWTKKLCI